MEDIPGHVEHVGDTYFHRAQEVARKAYGVHSNTMEIVCITDLKSATGVVCYVLYMHRHLLQHRMPRANEMRYAKPGVHLPSLACAKRINCKAGAYRGVGGGEVWGVQPPPRNSEDIGRVLDRMSRKNRGSLFPFVVHCVLIRL